ncbi:aquaporin [Saccharomonospora piscinae]|uniref:Aquaporin n=1 Tax=Saccharomonospora piscinae TaxID=687388 RepID=A0A1V8ZZH3_SACPI|nr:MIP/aquaporin family protein [Saccharomonospora piscinae]OQO90186.1 aquaporin [Saccharomonospora piscinae]TLW89594.1 aquaporin family protein [Saccharomonospora piscinae]
MSMKDTRHQTSGLTRLRQHTGGELLAEFLGTAVLILLGCGSVAVALAGLPGSGRQMDAFGPGNWLIIAFGWGLAVVFGVYVAGGVSGAHINPAVTLAFAVRRKFPWVKVVPYWIAQVLGAFTAAAIVYWVYADAINAFNAAEGFAEREDSVPSFSIFATFPAEYFGGGTWGPLLDQIVGTAFLVLAIAALIDSRNMAPQSNFGPWAIGFVVTAIGLSFGTNAGYAINPARDFGPRLLAYFAGWGDAALPGNGEWFSNYWWIPIAGPLIGGVVGILVYDLFIGQVLSAREKLVGVEGPPPGRVPEPTDETETRKSAE